MGDYSRGLALKTSRRDRVEGIACQGTTLVIYIRINPLIGTIVDPAIVDY